MTSAARTRTAIAAVALTLSGAVRDGGASDEHVLRATVSPTEVEPGAIAVVALDDPRLSPARVVGHFRGARLPFFAGADGRPRALVGVDLATPPGAHRLTVERTGDPESPPATIVLTVRAKQFPREDLTVDRRYIEPDARTLARIRREQKLLDAVLARVSIERLHKGPFQIPAAGPLGSPFGLRRFFNGQERSPHTGQDVRVPEGTPVAAAGRGLVVLNAPLFFSGNTLVLDHGLGLFTLYFHLQTFRVSEGTVVERGTVVGSSGKTGRVTGAHLHWAARVNGARVDPMALTHGPAAEESDGTQDRD